MARPSLSPAEARNLLDWHLAMGADEAISEAGVDRFALSAVPAPPSPKTVVAPTVSGDMLTSAHAAAAAATTLDALREVLERFDGCALKQTATRLVFADGTPGASVMLVGEAPGRDEDLQGLPFVGRSGQLLDRMLAAIGLDRGSVYIANVIPWRPPGNRTPTPQEVQVCLPFIQRQIELAAPEFLIFLGGAAASALTGATDGIGRLRGRWLACRVGERDLRALAMFHPAYLLRTPLAKRLAWRDLLALRRALDGAASRPPHPHSQGYSV